VQHFGVFFLQKNVRQPIGRMDSIQTVIRTSRRLDSFLYEAAQNFEVFSNIQNRNLKNLWVMSFSRAIHSHADPVWPEGTFKPLASVRHFENYKCIVKQVTLLRRNKIRETGSRLGTINHINQPYAFIYENHTIKI
jgi:hypothetical protein